MKLRFETSDVLNPNAIIASAKMAAQGLKGPPQDMYRCITGQSSVWKPPRRCIWSWKCSRRRAACLCTCRTSPVCGAAWGQRGAALLHRNNVLCCMSGKKRRAWFSCDTWAILIYRARLKKKGLHDMWCPQHGMGWSPFGISYSTAWSKPVLHHTLIRARLKHIMAQSNCIDFGHQSNTI